MRQEVSCDVNVERSLARIANDPEICDENKKLILEFSDRCFADGLTKGRMTKILYVMRHITHFLGKPYSGATKLDVQNVVSQIERSERFSDWSKHDFKAVLKKFYKWYKGNSEVFPDEVRWVKSRMRYGKKMLPENILTEEEVKLMAEKAAHPRDKAFVMTLYESGCRIGEMMSLRIRSVQFDEFGAVLRVSGKTGDRRVRVVCAAPLLATWIDLHPLRNDPDCFLWAGWQERWSRESFRYMKMDKQLKRFAVMAGIKRRVYPHLFRHSRATALASKLTEAQMKEHFGWVQGSDMASVYVHLSGRDVDEALLKTYGIKKDEEQQKKEETFKPKTCPRCKATSSPISKFCQKCGSVLDAETAYAMDEERKKASDMLDKLMENPDFKNMLLARVASAGLGDKL
jgi:integrase